VHALSTTRGGAGASAPPYDRFNLGAHVGDSAASVALNRARLRDALPGDPLWLDQVHGTAVVDAGSVAARAVPRADAAVARAPGSVLAVLTADCLPVLLCDCKGTVVAVAHAGWRGLAAGVIESAVRAMATPAAGIMAWLGPAIGPRAYEVGSEVAEAFIRADPAASAAFNPKGAGKFLADLYALARQRLARSGVIRVSGGDACTYGDASRFFSFRRDGRTGRMASLIWIED
jgi:YfiH family protein